MTIIIESKKGYKNARLFAMWMAEAAAKSAKDVAAGRTKRPFPETAVMQVIEALSDGLEAYRFRQNPTVEGFLALPAFKNLPPRSGK
jgi:hypothetical protein